MKTGERSRKKRIAIPTAESDNKEMLCKQSEPSLAEISISSSPQVSSSESDVEMRISECEMANNTTEKHESKVEIIEASSVSDNIDTTTNNDTNVENKKAKNRAYTKKSSYEVNVAKDNEINREEKENVEVINEKVDSMINKHVVNNEKSNGEESTTIITSTGVNERIQSSKITKNGKQVEKKDNFERKQAKRPIEEQKSFKNVINRTIFTILMAYIFLAIISMGIYAGLFVLLIIFFTMFKEIMRIPDHVYRKPQLPSAHFLKWYSLYFTIIYVIVYNFRKMLVESSPEMERLLSILPFVGFCYIMLGLILFVLSLRKGKYRSQFTHFTWTVMTVTMLGVQFAGEISNLMHGMIWFLLPVSCVVNNDIWAYICGKLFGRTKLLALSPKKTVEGFLGASVFTIIWAYWFCGFLSYFPEMYCPVVDFAMNNNVQCDRASIFEQHTVVMPLFVQQLTAYRLTSLRISAAQKHALILGTFASLVAPFAGFFASGLKRAFGLKDFGDLIPGHGGMTDRMDCQGLMGLFTYFYLRAYIYKEHKCAPLSKLLPCVLELSNADKTKLITQLQSSMSYA